ncbi:MAG: ABC transporter permease [Mesorhizobium sp.]|uniref:ABC transporter permease n=3 Tax=Mesorhizobium TaxID=68287 RepID=UPI000FCA1FB3|nr:MULTISPECIES: ABC transporter permease [unclassified Mesorhizobium]RUX46839.1 ABC transporter permease [Mesorhizobium sp. M4A.F.Ca.ET.050.02.1.1]RVD40497.1 ABC transporter permease [Mesorhizobium sp. M4A.F.Ca.ET.020.02.1.1]RWD00534.1 MAG: ABC transporter permease [Mesorhizobium sp.]RWD22808.1 MAG: ABC transporter permease [Mesorhizobium sp.]RWD24364.1 MAG: ABC transporter permease [Mesorhizobium sp.]
MSALQPSEVDRPALARGRPAADADLKSVSAALRRAEFGDRLRSLLLAAPLLILLALSFGIPIVLLLSRAVYDPTIADALPKTTVALAGWNGQGLPVDDGFAALAADLKDNQVKGTAYELAKSLNARLPGARSQVLKTVRKLENADGQAALEAMKSVPFWSAPSTWQAIRNGTHSLTSFYLLSALDMRWNADGGIERVPPEQAIFLQVFVRTFLVAAAVTLATLLLGFPLAYLIASAPKGLAAVLIVAVLLPFWTSILVRTAAWTVLLQKFGLVNDFLLFIGIASDRLDLMYSRIGLIIAMTHIQLPFTLLPIYSVMRTIQPSQMKAAYSLGAKPLTAFRRVYLPQVFPGVMAGCLLTFILCLGYYITPALIGGASDQLISNFIANYVNVELNWEMAAALSFILLVFTLALFGIFARILGLDRLKLV